VTSPADRTDMRTFTALLLLFILLPWLELWLLFRLSNEIGAGTTLGVILLTGVVGAALARHQGTEAVLRIRRALLEGRIPAAEVVDGFLIFAAGLLLITPGLLTDAVGFLLLVPPVRAAVRKWAGAWFRHRVEMHVWPPPATEDGADDADVVIDIQTDEVGEDR